MYDNPMAFTNHSKFPLINFPPKATDAILSEPRSPKVEQSTHWF